MIHYGDITKISGYDVPIVDCVVGGSPCQDLSVAGKRAGLDGERSGLFMEQIRITKEMRYKDERVNGRSGVNVRPRFFVWENVPGALSSNKGQDFKVVLEEVAKIIDKDAVIPMPPKDKWTTSGAIVGDGWSIAWRVCDAQFWGVPQRRRRISLVADFGGQCAQEILFERRSLSGDIEESRTERQGVTEDAQGCIGIHDSNGRKSVAFEPGIASREGGHIYENVSGTLRANMGDNQMSVAYEWHSQDLRIKEIKDGISPTLSAGMGMGGASMTTPMLIQEIHCYDIGDRRSVANESVDVSPTLLSKMGTGGNNVPVVVEEDKCMSFHLLQDVITSEKISPCLSQGNSKSGQACVGVVVQESVVGLDGYNQCLTGDKALTLRAARGDNEHLPLVVIDRSAYNQGENAQYNIGIDENGTAFSHIAKGPGAVCYIDTSHADDVVRTDDVVAPLQARDYKGGKLIVMATQQGGAEIRIDDKCPTLTAAAGMSGNNQPVICYNQPKYIVRRLTPLECERLQGYPDFYTDIGEYTDSKGKKKKSSDSARYKALGNSIALPQWKWIIKRLCSHYERDATLCSLFDGIGGFPYLWEQINGKGSCLWASEIEDFPIAVTKSRIG